MKEKLSVLYVIYLDKFTKMFVDFFRREFAEFNNKFILYGKKQQFKFDADENEIVFVDSYKQISKNSLAYKWANNSDKIIFSGIFGSEKLFFKFPRGTVNKSYFQFWGGDFYDLRNKLPVYKIKGNLSNVIKIHYIKNVRGIINLIPGDYEELKKMIKIDADHFIAPVCGNGKNLEIYNSLFSTAKSDDPINICLGNSATKTNNHLEILDSLQKYKNENIKIICPLSYGDKNYADEVIAHGKKIFGNKFEPLTNYMSKEDYFTILSNCKIGVFNNNRQQGMGNINALLTMGVKVYIKSNTSMWETYTKERGYILYNIDEISKTDFNEFVKFDDSAAVFNFNKAKYYNSKEYKKMQWQFFFKSIFEGVISNNE